MNIAYSKTSLCRRQWSAAVMSCMVILLVSCSAKPPEKTGFPGTWFNFSETPNADNVIYKAEAFVFGPIHAQFAAVFEKPDKQAAEKAFDAALRAVNELNSWASVYQENSAVSVFNKAKTGERVQFPAGIEVLHKVTLEAFEITGGAFDPSVKPMIDLYRKCRKENRLPTAEERVPILPQIGYRHIILNDDDTLQKDMDGVMVDFGGIAKGLGIDEAVEAMKAAGAKSGLVEIGGDLRVFGRRPDSSGWRVGIVNPVSPTEIYGVIEAPPKGTDDIAVVTSGDYEQVYEAGGVKYTHIFYPKTGEPIAYRGAGITVAAETATKADALATGFFVIGREESLKTSDRENIPVLWLESDKGRIDLTSSGPFAKTYTLEVNHE